MIINKKKINCFFAKISRIKNPFIEIKDFTGKIQIYTKKKFLIGDIIFIIGILKKTKKKIFYIFPYYIKKVLNNIKYISFNNKNFFNFFCLKNFIQNYLNFFSFVKVDTFILNKNKSNSNSNIFKTFNFCKKKFFYLKISPELNIKKILSININRVYEITKCFRNEGKSNIHNFEFTMLEYYSYNFTFNNSLKFLEKILKQIFFSFNKTYVKIGKNFFNLKFFFKKFSLLELILIKIKKFKNFLFFKNLILKFLLFKNINLIRGLSYSDLLLKIFNFLINKHYFPFFVKKFTRLSSPLTKMYYLNFNFVKRFELYICKIELSNGFDELNDYYIQKYNFKKKNKDFLLYIKNNFFNTNGVGLGLDRVFMILFNIKNINFLNL